MLVALVAILISILLLYNQPNALQCIKGILRGSGEQRVVPSIDDKPDKKMGANASSEAGLAVTEEQTSIREDKGNGDEEGSSPSTPRARPAEPLSRPVPTFALSEDEPSDDVDRMPPPAFPALNSAQRARGPASSLQPNRGPPTLKPVTNGSPTDAQLMPPPPRLASSRPQPGSTNALRVPTTGPLPNRGPPRSSNSLAPPPYKVTNMRNKVALTPGHSPLDWAALQRSSSNLSGVNSLIRVTPSQLKSMNGRKGKPAWSSYQGKVYNITPYIPYHPGGEGEIRRASGKDGEKLFLEVHPWVNWDNMLGECLVGIMVGEHDGAEATNGSLEDMD